MGDHSFDGHRTAPTCSHFFCIFVFLVVVVVQFYQVLDVFGYVRCLFVSVVFLIRPLSRTVFGGLKVSIVCTVCFSLLLLRYITLL